MNKQLLELAAKAGIDTEAWRTYPGGFPREDYFVMKKFAELIVQECISRVEPSEYHYAYPDNVLGSYEGLRLLEQRVCRLRELIKNV